MFFWRRVAPQIPEEGLKPTATPGYTRNFRDLNSLVSRGKSFSGYERNAMFLNKNGKGFAEVGGLLGIDFDDDGRAVALADWDQDGDLDMWVTNRTAPRVRLLRNNQPSTNAYIAIRLIGNGQTTNRDAIGARLVLSHSSNPQRSQIRTVHAGDGFLAQSTAWTHFGLGTSRDELDLTVAWPGGSTETFSGLEAGTHYTVTQGKGFVPSRPAAKTIPKARNVPVAAGKKGFWVVNRIPFPELTYTDHEGTSRSTTDLLGKSVLINLWATWCPQCVEELGDFGKHAESLTTNGLAVLALNVDGLAVDGSATSDVNAAELLEKVGYKLPYGFASQEDLAKIEILIEYLSSRRVPLSIPSSFLVDAKGNLAAVYLEPVAWQQLAADFALLKAPSEKQLSRATPRPGRWLVDPRRVVDRAAYLGDYATLYGTNGFPRESRRLQQMVTPQETAKDARSFYNQARSAAQQGQTDEAMKLYRAAIRLDSKYGEALTGLGAMLLMQKRLGEAEPLFEKALSIDPNHATALINLARIDQSRGDHESALRRLKSVIRRNPDYAEAHLNLGSLLASMKKHDEAIKHLSQAVRINPQMEAGHINLAAVYIELEQWEKAEAHYGRLQRMNSRMAAYAHYGLGNVKARQEQHKDAVNSYRKAISLGATNAQTFTRLGLSYFAIGDKKSAVDALKKALEIDPRFSAARQALDQIGPQ